MEIPPQKYLIIEVAPYDAKLGPASSVGMHPPLGIFMEEVRQFATQKRVASDIDPLHAPKKSQEVKLPIGSDFDDGQDAIQQLFPDLDLNSIVVPSAEEEEEGGDDGSPTGPMEDGAPATTFVPTKLVVPTVPTTSIEGILGPSVLTSLAHQSAIEALSEDQGTTPTELVPPMDIALMIKVEAIPDQPSKQSVIE
ncbi:hypothetical protein COCNU_06G017460 [Cocos nucifera]|uniref:Uncharacterized protein n=1 Tax=Cocos nucifera TaxID=13894 RepID=A0A8K0N4A9_COCNU|nr:hypothetical protein COCNU_06G017460 [Cocos nucifera]